MKNSFLVIILLALFARCGSDGFKPTDDGKLIIDKSTVDYKIVVYVKSTKRKENSLLWRISNRELVAYNLPFMNVASSATTVPLKYFTSNISDSLKNRFFDIQVKKPFSNVLSDSSMWKTVLYELSAYYEVKKSERFETIEANVIFVAEPELLATFENKVLSETQYDNDSLKLESATVETLASFLNNSCDINIVTDIESKMAYKFYFKKSCTPSELLRELERFGLGLKTEMRPQVFYTFSQ